MAADKDYLRHILNLYKKFDTGCLYFTSDGPLYTMLNGGNLKDECLEVANFGSRPEIQFETLKELFPDRPLMCGEYWDGWFDHWGENHHVRPIEEVVSDFVNFICDYFDGSAVYDFRRAFADFKVCI